MSDGRNVWYKNYLRLMNAMYKNHLRQMDVIYDTKIIYA